MGIQKKLAELNQERPSKLMDVLLEELGLGFMSSPAVVRVAGAAVEDGLISREVSTAARCGHSGLYPGNCWRDLTRGIQGRLGPILPSVHYVMVPWPSGRILDPSWTLTGPFGPQEFFNTSTCNLSEQDMVLILTR